MRQLSLWLLASWTSVCEAFSLRGQATRGSALSLSTELVSFDSAGDAFLALDSILADPTERFEAESD